MSHPLRFALAVLVLALASPFLAAPATAIDVCGNGICHSTTIPPETPQSCPADCGPGPNDCVADTCDLGSCSRPEAGVDRDLDGVPDRLEHDLAHKFFPAVLLQWHGEDRAESYLFKDRATPYTLRPWVTSHPTCDGAFECLEIRWGVTFFFDHGDTPFDLYEHLGDSEMYAGLLRRSPFWEGAPDDAEGWDLIRDFTSAHWGTSSDSSVVAAYGYCPNPCSDHHGDFRTCAARSTCAVAGVCIGPQGCSDLTLAHQCRDRACTWFPACFPSFPWGCYAFWPKMERVPIFSAESKHALYHSDDECDDGGWHGSDDCPNNQFDMSEWKDGLLQNVGNEGAHDGFDTKIQDPTKCGHYDVWSGLDFGAATSYRAHFTAPLNWALDGDGAAPGGRLPPGAAGSYGSVSVRVRPAAMGPGTTWVCPEGQRTSTESTVSASPRPK